VKYVGDAALKHDRMVVLFGRLIGERRIVDSTEQRPCENGRSSFV